MDDAMQILERMHSDRRAVALESVQVATNDAVRTSLQWRASAINDRNDTVFSDGSTPLEALVGLRMLIYQVGGQP